MNDELVTVCRVVNSLQSTEVELVLGVVGAMEVVEVELEVE